MFTGLIQDVGLIRGAHPAGEAVSLQIQTRLAGELADGDSLAVDGVCLTVTSTGPDLAAATAVPETLDRTTLGRLGPGDRVNLEPALKLGDRLGGHIVQGHVDGLGTVVRLRQRGPSREVTVEAPGEILRYVVHKGSIAVSGVSLTVAALDSGSFTVALVPHTMAATTLLDAEVGQRVNLEVDLLAKYVERMMGARQPDEPGGGRITEKWLREQGML